MGWLIGPRFRIPSEPDQPVSFRHVPIQHSLTGIVSVPSWWNEVKLVTKTYWLDENGDRHETGSPQPIEQTIPLPSGTRGIDDILNPKPREPKVEERSPVPDVLTACEQGTLIIRGSQLWRSTVVTLGGQQADAIAVLPNMEGIIATFDQVQPLPASTDPEPDEAYLVVWTSEGEEPAGRVQITGDKKCE